MPQQLRATLAITHCINEKNQTDYEKWLKKIIPQAATFPGHLGVNIIRPVHSGDPYTILVRFETEEDLLHWNNSVERKALIDEITPLLQQSDLTAIHRGAEFWFTPANSTRRSPARWKQYLMTLLVIYPSTNLVPWFWGLFLPQLKGSNFGHLLNDATVVALVVFLWMPLITRLFHRWLAR
jgi:antibiotic biosynthesis monooxygenase (ABM) superfamily enzyme